MPDKEETPLMPDSEEMAAGPRETAGAAAQPDGQPVPVPVPVAVAGGGAPEVHGAVRHPDGTPVTGATVTVIDLTGRQAGRDRTGADGSYRIPVPGQQPYTLIAMAGAHQPHAAAVYVGRRPVELQVVLSGSSRLTGRVRVAGDGAPAAGATVALADRRGEIIAAAVTDAAGRYAFDDMVPGGYTLTISAPSCQPAALPVTVAEGMQTTQDAELTAAGRLEGVALTTGGTPVADARVALLDQDGNTMASVTTAADGRYSFENVQAGDYTVIASGYPPAASRLHVVAGRKHQHDVQLSHPRA